MSTPSRSLRSGSTSPQTKGYTSPKIRAANRALAALESNIFHCAATGNLPAMERLLGIDADAHKAEGYIPTGVGTSEGYAHDAEFQGTKPFLGFYRVVPTATERENKMFACTPLFIAAAEGHTAVVAFLLEKGADATKTAKCWGRMSGKGTQVRVDEIVLSRMFQAHGGPLAIAYREILALVRRKGPLSPFLTDVNFPSHIAHEWAAKENLKVQMTGVPEMSPLTAAVVECLDAATAPTLFFLPKLQEMWRLGHALDQLRHKPPDLSRPSPVKGGEAEKKQSDGHGEREPEPAAGNISSPKE